MKAIIKMHIRLEQAIVDGFRPRPGRERGDVPGWVLITLMTAGIVAALWTVAQDKLVALFNNAIASVTR